MNDFKNIVVSGVPVAGKSKLVESIADVLRLERISIEDNFKAEYKRRYSKNQISFDDYYRKISPEWRRKIVDDFTRSLEKGGVVADSSFAPSADTTSSLMVFITADLNARATRALIRQDYAARSFGQVKHYLIKREEDEFNVGMSVLGVDYRDPVHYHLVLNSGRLTIMEELEQIRTLFRPPPWM